MPMQGLTTPLSWEAAPGGRGISVDSAWNAVVSGPPGFELPVTRVHCKRN